MRQEVEARVEALGEEQRRTLRQNVEALKDLAQRRAAQEADD